jgi:hypothetical protein
VVTTTIRSALAWLLVLALAGTPRAWADPPPPATQPTAPRRDPLLNGMLIGGAIGFGVGFLGMAAYNARETASGPIWDAEALGIYTSAGLLGAAIGAGFGLVVDLVRPSRGPGIGGRGRTVDVVPVLDGRRRGLLLSFRR